MAGVCAAYHHCIQGKEQMTEVEYSHKLLRDKFIERDNRSIEELRYSNYGIEAKLNFAYDRLEDLCGVVMKLLEELDKEKNK
jgi:hypothetical protein